MVSDDKNKTTEDSRFRDLSPGKLLVWGRERAGLTQEQVAKELYMTLTKVRALESDDYRHMGSDTFTRGYLRSYASLVKLDVNQLLSAYDRHAQDNGLVEQVLPRKQESTTKPLWQFAVLIVAVLLVLWLISVWFFDNRKQPEIVRAMAINPQIESFVATTSSEAASENSEVASSAGLVTTAVDAIESDEPSSARTDSSIASSFSKNSSSVSSVTVNSVLQAGTLDQLVFVFSEECWLEVSDSRGDVLMTDLQAAGTRLVLHGKAPFDVKLGNAPGAQVELNNEKIAIVPALGTNVLSLKVGKSAN